MIFNDITFVDRTGVLVWATEVFRGFDMTIDPRNVPLGGELGRYRRYHCLSNRFTLAIIRPRLLN